MTKNTKNGLYYKDIIAEMKQTCANRGEEFQYDINQTRSRFKRCVRFCRKAALTTKMSSGIKRFQEEREFGPLFQKLYEVVYIMANC